MPSEQSSQSSSPLQTPSSHRRQPQAASHQSRLSRAEKRIAEKTSVKLDLACGQTKREGFIGIDIAPCEGVDIVHDLRVLPWPFEDESVDEVFCSHFLEHLDGIERIAFMQELWRVMKVDATATIITPYWSSVRAIQDPTHKWPPIAENSYLYWNQAWMRTNKLEHYNIKCNFDFGYQIPIGDPTFAARNDEYKAFANAHYINVGGDIQVLLTRRVMMAPVEVESK